MNWANPAIEALQIAGYQVHGLKLPLAIVAEYEGAIPADYPDMYENGEFAVVKNELKQSDRIPENPGELFAYNEEVPVTFEATLIDLPKVGESEKILSGGNFSIYADNGVEVKLESTTAEALNIVLRAGYHIRGADASRVRGEPPGR